MDPTSHPIQPYPKRRAPIACTRCRKRKIRCIVEPDGGCMACRQACGPVCVYERVGTSVPHMLPRRPRPYAVMPFRQMPSPSPAYAYHLASQEAHGGRPFQTYPFPSCSTHWIRERTDHQHPLLSATLSTLEPTPKPTLPPTTMELQPSYYKPIQGTIQIQDPPHPNPKNYSAPVYSQAGSDVQNWLPGPQNHDTLGHQSSHLSSVHSSGRLGGFGVGKESSSLYHVPPSHAAEHAKSPGVFYMAPYSI
ncbi:hypothetical protein BDV96DRAFT_591561 [Lophiotrema nucula]|uniref:Zn(2)-C6 fungal-type domain-containing protein n=1 Tax=Lophiotrema nucula TaxID=690887 RepID=A0A6A5YFZ9_9PLEO|nr:hypothetical protein BDV96DRAFT_591561 [Lophiotrema nucula]